MIFPQAPEQAFIKSSWLISKKIDLIPVIGHSIKDWNCEFNQIGNVNLESQYAGQFRRCSQDQGHKFRSEEHTLSGCYACPPIAEENSQEYSELVQLSAELDLKSLYPVLGHPSVDMNLPFNWWVVLINELFGKRKELFFCADVFRLSYLLRREHDGPHTDVLSASRSLEGKEVWAVT